MGEGVIVINEESDATKWVDNEFEGKAPDGMSLKTGKTSETEVSVDKSREEA